MMAKRYSGNLQISVVYDDKNYYRTAVSRDGKLLWRGIVRPAPAGFGPGVAYDSPKAYDEIASTALAFAEDEIGGIADEAEFDEDLTGYLIRRSPRTMTASSRQRPHATRRNNMGDARLATNEEPLTEADYRQAAKFDMDRFGLTLPEAMKLVKDKRYPGILKTIDDWRARYGWPAANSGLTRGYIYELLGMQRGRRR
jgi:hypothetical protein